LNVGLDNGSWTVYNIPSGLGYLLRPSGDGPDFSVTPFEVPECDNENLGYGYSSFPYMASGAMAAGRSIYAGYTTANYKRSNSVSSQLEEDVAEAQCNSAAAEAGEEVFGLTATKRSLQEMQMMTLTEIVEELQADAMLWCFKCGEDVLAFEVLGHHDHNKHCLYMVHAWEDALKWEDDYKAGATYDVRTGKMTSLSDYCPGCDRMIEEKEITVGGMCAACAFYSPADGGDYRNQWECS